MQTIHLTLQRRLFCRENTIEIRIRNKYCHFLTIPFSRDDERAKPDINRDIERDPNQLNYTLHHFPQPFFRYE